MPRLERAVVVVLENREAGDVLGSREASYLNALARRYATLTRYFALAHPSLPNYLALVSGTTGGVTDDCTDCVVHARNLADTLEAAAKTWKAYAEDLPHPGFTGASAGGYAKKHEPFTYFADVLSSPARLRRTVPLTQLARDLRTGRLPSFSLVTPNLCHDMHDCSTADGDRWLRTFLPPLVASPQLRRGAVFVVFDEGSSREGGGGHVAALVLGQRVRPHAVSRTRLDHLSLLRTLEDALGLERLGGSADAPPITGIWR